MIRPERQVVSLPSTARGSARRLLVGILAAATTLCAALTGVCGGVAAQAEGLADQGSSQGARIEISHDPQRQPEGWGRTPTTPEQAAAEGFHPDEQDPRFWYRDIEIVPREDKPTAEGLRYWVADEGDFVKPSDVAETYNAVSTYRNLTPVASVSAPGADGSDDAGAAVPQRNIGVFQAEGTRYFFTLNAGALMPTSEVDYIPQSPRYSPQTGFRDLPELGYIGTLLARVGLLSQTRVPAGSDYSRVRTALLAEYRELANNDVSGASALDPRLSKAEVKAVLQQLLTGGTVDGEVIEPQPDATHPDSRSDTYDPPAIGDARRGVLCGIEYAHSHYATGVELNSIGEIRSPGDLSQEDYTVRAVARLLIAYTEAAQAKGVGAVSTVPETLTSDEVTSVDEGNDTIFSITFNPSTAKTVLFCVPTTSAADRSKVSFLVDGHRRDWGLSLSLPGCGGMAATQGFVLDTDQPYRIRVPRDMSDALVEAFRHAWVYSSFTGSTLGMVAVPKSDYRFDESSGHWLVRQWARIPQHGEDRAVARTASGRYQALVGFQNQTTNVILAMGVNIAGVYSPEVLSFAEAAGERGQLWGYNNPEGDPSDQPALLYGDALRAQGMEIAGSADVRKRYRVPIRDHVVYRDLDPNTEYLAWGRLLATDELTVDPDTSSTTYADGSARSFSVDSTPVATGAATFVPANTVQAPATYRLDLGQGVIEEGRRYVIVETVSPAANVSNLDEVLSSRGAIPPTFKEEAPVLRHERTDDLSQTVYVVPETLRTQVEARGQRATVADQHHQAEAAVVHAGDLPTTDDGRVRIAVHDTVYYRGLDPRQSWIAQARLMRVADDGSLAPVRSRLVDLNPQSLPRAPGEQPRAASVYDGTMTTEELPEYTVDVDFADPEDPDGKVALAPGTYVVMEQVTPAENIANLDALRKAEATGAIIDPIVRDEARVIRHEDPLDAAQTFHLRIAEMMTRVAVTNVVPDTPGERPAQRRAALAGVDGAESSVPIRLTSDQLVTPKGEQRDAGQSYVEMTDTVILSQLQDGVYTLTGLLRKNGHDDDGSDDAVVGRSEDVVVRVSGVADGNPVVTASQTDGTAVPVTTDEAGMIRVPVAFAPLRVDSEGTYVVHEVLRRAHLDEDGHVLGTSELSDDELDKSDGDLILSHSDRDDLAQTLTIAPTSTTVMGLPHSGVDGTIVVLLLVVPGVAGLLGWGAARLRRRRA